MSRIRNPFSSRALLGLVVAAAALLLLTLYALSAGWNGEQEKDGRAHAAANGLNGFSALPALLKKRGYDVSLSRSRDGLDSEALLVLTPQQDSDAEQIWEIVKDRRYQGPTLIILPKWVAVSPRMLGNKTKVPDGWVTLVTALPPSRWSDDDGPLGKIDPEIGEHGGWYGMGLRAKPPKPEIAQAMRGTGLRPIVTDDGGTMLAGYLDDNGYYEILGSAADEAEARQRVVQTRAAIDEDDIDDSLWPVVIVSEPDLLNNYGLADENRARMAVALIDTTIEDYDIPIVFDLTVAGLGTSKNLLTLAFTPPFLAATLCLLLAALVVVWRAFLPFGPRLAEAPALAHGKQQLARNGAALVERTRRLHLLGPAYAAMASARIARLLGLRETEPHLRDSAIETALAARGRAELDYPAKAAALHSARRARDLLRSARAMKDIERKLGE